MNFADKCHHAKEETALFPALTRASPKEGAFLVRRLELDHKAARQLVAVMPAAAATVEIDDEAARAAFAKSARTDAALLQEHVHQETSTLFPLTDSVLPAKERTVLGAEFDRIEREETGEGFHEKYEGTIHRPADKYVHRIANAR